MSLECEERVNRGRVCSEGERVLEAPRTKGASSFRFAKWNGRGGVWVALETVTTQLDGWMNVEVERMRM